MPPHPPRSRPTATVLPPIPLDPFRLCLFERHRPIEIAFVCLSLFFGVFAYASTSTHNPEPHVFSDFSAFSVILRFGFKAGFAANAVAVSRPSIVHTIVQDATVYFFVIFTSQLILLLTLVFERPTLQLLPSVGNDVLLPIMISRLIISLKKAASGDGGWASTEMTTVRRVEGMRFKKYENSIRTRPFLGGDRARNGFRATRRLDSEQVSEATSEEISMGTLGDLAFQGHPRQSQLGYPTF